MSDQEFPEGTRVSGLAAYPEHDAELVDGVVWSYQVGARPDLLTVMTDAGFIRSVIRRSAQVIDEAQKKVPSDQAFDSGQLTAILGEPAPFTTKSSGARAAFANGGVRDTESGKPRFDLIRPQTVPYADQMLSRFAALMSRGAEKYAARNWERFSDSEALERARSSAARHFEQWFNGEQDEDHAAAVYFNIMAVEYVKGVLNGWWPAATDEEGDG